MWHFAVHITDPISVDADLTVDSSQDPVVALVGQNGAGKSTLLRALAGFNGQSQGDLTGPPWRRPLTWVPQQPSLLPHRTIRQQVEWVLRGRCDRDEEMRQWVDVLDLGETLEQRPAKLSGGEQQRAAILRALAAHPTILAVDEAMSQIDAPSRELVAWRLRQWAEEQADRLLIITTHQFADVAYLADRVLVMADGCTLRQDDTREVARDPKTWAVAALVGFVAMVQVDTGLMAVRTDDVHWDLPGAAMRGMVSQVRERELVIAIQVAAGRPQFFLPRSHRDLKVGDVVTVYLRGAAIRD